MKKMFIFAIIFTLMNLCAFAYELNGVYNGFFDGNAPYATSSFIFDGNRYEANIFFDDAEIPSVIGSDEVIYENGGWKYTEKGAFQLRNSNGVYYIDWNTSKLFTTYGIIFNEIEMILYDNNKIKFSPGIGGNIANIFPYIKDIKATSELMENIKEYYAKNMLSQSPIPWVEAVGGYGVGEMIILKIWQHEMFPFKGFIISNGYVDFLRPDLYNKNSRIKSIEIISPTGTKNEFFLEDTSLFQVIELSENMLSNEGECEYQIIIKDIYRGELWEDTCINIIDTIVPYLRNDIK